MEHPNNWPRAINDNRAEREWVATDPEQWTNLCSTVRDRAESLAKLASRALIETGNGRRQAEYLADMLLIENGVRDALSLSAVAGLDGTRTT